MPKIRLFNGGLRTAQADHLLAEHESRSLVNADHITGILKPVPDRLLGVSGAQRYGHFFTVNSTWYWSATPKDYVEFQERLYIGNRSGVSTKIVGGTEYNMGIQQPTTVPTVVISDEVPEQNQITRLDLVASTDAAADIPADITIKYKVVNISATSRKYVSESVFSLRVTSALAEGHADYDHNKIAVTCTDTNIDTTIAIFRFFDNYWRKVYEGAGGGTPTFSDATYDISANDDDTNYQATGLNGTYQYALTFYNSTDGTESAPVLSTEYEADWGIATVSNLEIATDPQVTHRKLYRIGGASTAFTLVTTLDNIVVSYVDSFKDDELEGSLMESEQNFPPPATGMKYMMESYAMLFAADGDKLRFTPIGQPDYWPQTYYLDFPRPITGLAKTPIGVLVFNEYETWLVTGTGPLSLAQQLLTGSQGCINGDTVVNIEGSALWFSTDGVCMSNGGTVGVITRDKMGKYSLDSTVNAVVYDDRYHLLLLNQGTTLVLDLARNVIKQMNYGISSLFVANDTLYGYDAGYLYELEADPDNLMLMQYISPRYIGRGFNTVKTYKNFYIFSEGQINIQIFIDSILVQTAELPQTKWNHQVKIPTENTRGYGIQFSIVGTGTVYEVSWEEGNANQ